jgi:ParB family chromosome partitioning protein
MQIQQIPIEKLRPAAWNPNMMTPGQLAKLKRSIQDFGIVQNFVVRPIDDDRYEVLAGNQRLKAYQELGLKTVSCVIVEGSDSKAKLLAQILNHLHGEDDLGLRAALVEDILAGLDKDEILAYLPDGEEDIDVLVNMRHSTLEEAFSYWQDKIHQGRHEFQAVLDDSQHQIVQKAIGSAKKELKAKAGRANTRALALTRICQLYLESRGL